MPVVTVTVHHVREGAAREEACDCTTLPPVGWPRVEQCPPHELRTEIARRRSALDGKSCRGDRQGGDNSRQLRGRGRRRPDARSKAAMASSQLVRVSIGSQVSRDASQPAQGTMT